MDVVQFCSDLISCRSVTPYDDGAIDYINNFLNNLGFESRILEFSEGQNTVKNLFARYTKGQGKKFGFLGHSDVVPAGDMWDTEPFTPVISDGYLIGRGVADMKGGISAFCCALGKFISSDFPGEIYVFITGDEEIGTYQGIRSLLEWANKNKFIPDDCLIGEPSSKERIGDRVYIGHRGSANINIKINGKQGHAAYPESYDNSLMKLCNLISELKKYNWKYSDKRYPKTNLEPTLLYTGNYAENVVPGESSANINIRFGGDYTSETIKNVFEKISEPYNVKLDFRISGEAYCCDDINLQKQLTQAIQKETGLVPEFSAGGGTSDGRYMIRYCNVIEFGLQDATIHQCNERAKIKDLKTLENIYFRFLKNYFQ